MKTYLITNQQSMFTPEGYSFCSVQQCLSYLAKLDDIGFDSETRGFDPYTKELLTIQLGDDKKQFVIDCRTVDIQLFKPIIEEKVMIMQNAKFDLQFLYRHRIVPGRIFDTFLVERILTTGIPTARKALDVLVWKYCKQSLDKSVRGNIHREGLTTRVIKYAGDDVKYLPEIKRKQEYKLREQGLLRTAMLDNDYVKVLAYTEYCGVKLDTTKWKAKCLEDRRHLENKAGELDNFIFANPDLFPHLIDNQINLFDDSLQTRINWNSSKQVIPFMQKLGINTQVKDKKTGLMKHSIDKKVLGPQKKKHPIVPLYIEYSEANKVVTTYGENWFDYINPVTKRIHTNYTQIMNTGRLSSGQKGNKKRGIPQKPNMQNVPGEDRTRSCFTTNVGNILIVADYSGQEQVVLANKSLEPNLLEFYAKGLGDMHSFIAKKIFAEELADVELHDIKKARPDLRQLAKAAGFAINYGGVGMTIAMNLGVPLETGEMVYKAYFEAFPGLDAYFKKQRAKAVKDGFITFNDVSHRKCYVYGFEEFQALHKELYDDKTFWTEYKKQKLLDTEYFRNHLKPKVREYFVKKGGIERDALNYPVQGTSADITKLAGIYFFRHLVENDLLFTVLMPNVVHDEIHAECPIDMAKKMSGVLKQCMEDAGDVFCKTVPLKADPCITPYWTH
jgi:DNA polymerase-1